MMQDPVVGGGLPESEFSALDSLKTNEIYLTFSLRRLLILYSSDVNTSQTAGCTQACAT